MLDRRFHLEEPVDVRRAGDPDEVARDVVDLDGLVGERLVPDDVSVGEDVDGTLAREVVPAVQVADRGNLEPAGRADVVGLDGVLRPDRRRDEDDVRPVALDGRDDGRARLAAGLDPPPERKHKAAAQQPPDDPTLYEPPGLRLELAFEPLRHPVRGWMPFAEVDSPVHQRAAAAEPQVLFLDRLGPVADDDVWNLGLGDLDASALVCHLLLLPGQLRPNPRIVHLRAVQERHLMAAGVQLAHHRVQVAEEVHVLHHHQDLHGTG
ncbi:MAG TPA: hypothetical protein VNJ54_02085, partial [Plantibacter sp.]|uniref:hypothetical protein n=1 Tax=Plantibacter sp. TaxID=1871045 RepID=UPI002C113AA6|nr:hypothetical protein [Plantibacter sp.]